MKRKQCLYKHCKEDSEPKKLVHSTTECDLDRQKAITEAGDDRTQLHSKR